MDIVKIIQETATWIEKVNKDFETNLYRSPELNTDRHLIYIADYQHSEVMEAVAEKRTLLLNKAKVELIPINELHLYGRIMIFDVLSTVVDGAPESESKFFVDINDTPPVDTWIALGSQFAETGIYQDDSDLFNQSILAWVPASQYFYVNEALLVACVDNFSWPSPQGLGESYKFLEMLFTEPKIEEPNYPININRRIYLIEKFQKELDEESVVESFEHKSYPVSFIDKLLKMFQRGR